MSSPRVAPQDQPSRTLPRTDPEALLRWISASREPFSSLGILPRPCPLHRMDMVASLFTAQTVIFITEMEAALDLITVERLLSLSSLCPRQQIPIVQIRHCRRPWAVNTVTCSKRTFALTMPAPRTMTATIISRHPHTRTFQSHTPTTQSRFLVTPSRWRVTLSATPRMTWTR